MNEPAIKLSGAVYTNGNLTKLYPQRCVPPSPQPGDTRITAFLDQRGSKAVALDLKRKKRGTLKRTKCGYSGRFKVDIFDGDRWRTLLIENIAGVHTRYRTQSAKESYLSDLLWALETLAGDFAERTSGGFHIVATPARDACLARRRAFAALQIAEMRAILSGGTLAGDENGQLSLPF